jgi:subtilisin family serine protease
MTIGRVVFALAAAGTIAAGAVAAPKPKPIDPRKMELLLSWGIAHLDAQRVYRKGKAGEGVVIAMVDTGVSGDRKKLFARISPFSTDLIANRLHGESGADHGGQTAGVLAGARDGSGTMGVAYDATLLEIRADTDGSCRDLCSMTGPMLARGIDYAVEHGAKVIGLPLASTTPLPSVEPALERAARKGVLIVAAAGNEGADEPVWPARYAADPRYLGAIIVAGASARDRKLASWSNRAGSAASNFLVAPGDQIYVDCNTEFCGVVSGTSYSVSYVAGAAALLMGRYPHLDGIAAGRLLLEGAETGRKPRATTGRGNVDVNRAARLAERQADARS